MGWMSLQCESRRDLKVGSEVAVMSWEGRLFQLLVALTEEVTTGQGPCSRGAQLELVSYCVPVGGKLE